MDIVSCVKDANGDRVVETDSGYYPPKLADAYIIAAAPTLYSCLVEAQAQFCSQCLKYGCDKECYVLKWKDALAYAQGRSIYA